jgi:hypothetical protein
MKNTFILVVLLATGAVAICVPSGVEAQGTLRVAPAAPKSTSEAARGPRRTKRTKKETAATTRRDVGRGVLIGGAAGLAIGGTLAFTQTNWIHPEKGEIADAFFMTFGSAALGAALIGLLVYASPTGAENEHAARPTKKRASANWVPTLAVAPDGSGASVGLTGAF